MEPRSKPKARPVTPSEPLGDYLTPGQAATVVHLSTRTLEGLRYRGDGPPFAKLGKGRSARILYRRTDLDAWIASQLRQSTTTG